MIESFAVEKKIPILMRIPLSRKIAESYAKGDLLVEAFPEYQQAFSSLYTDIQTMVIERQLTQ